MLAPRLDNQHQRGNVPRSVLRLGDGHQLDVHHERRHHGRAAEHHRPTASDRARGRQRVAHQPFETDPIGQRVSSSMASYNDRRIRSKAFWLFMTISASALDEARERTAGKFARGGARPWLAPSPRSPPRPVARQVEDPGIRTLLLIRPRDILLTRAC